MLLIRNYCVERVKAHLVKNEVSMLKRIFLTIGEVCQFIK